MLATNPIIDSYFQSDLFGKGIFLSLLILSILTWVLFLKKGLYIKNLEKEASQLLENYKNFEKKPLMMEITFSHPYVEVYKGIKKKTIELLHKNQLGQENSYLYASDIQLLDAHLGSTISKQINFLEKDLFILSTVISLAPFLGLLGTVWGILLTFTELHAGHMMEKSSLIMAGLSMALGTTVVGLLVAIPALIAYNYLKSKISHFETALQDFGTLFLTSIEINYRKSGE